MAKRKCPRDLQECYFDCAATECYREDLMAGKYAPDAPPPAAEGAALIERLRKPIDWTKYGLTVALEKERNEAADALAERDAEIAELESARDKDIADWQAMRAERDALRQALRRVAISASGACELCGCVWHEGEPEEHAPDCLAKEG